MRTSVFAVSLAGCRTHGGWWGSHGLASREIGGGVPVGEDSVDASIVARGAPGDAPPKPQWPEVNAPRREVRAFSYAVVFILVLGSGLLGGWAEPVVAQEATETLSTVPSFAYKSPEKASRLSLLCTAVPVAAGVVYWSVQGGSEFGGEPNRSVPAVLIGTGLMFGPSVGHLYAGRVGLLPLRAIVAGATAGAALGYAADHHEDGWEALGVTAGILAIGGGIATITSIIDIARAGRAARKYNEEHDVAQVGVTPAMLDGGRVVGLAVAASF